MRMTLLAFLMINASARADYDIATFADTGYITGANQYANMTGGFTSGGQFFNNTWHSDYQYATGFSVSSMTDTTTPGYLNQYSAITGHGNGDMDYAILTPTAYVNLSGIVQSIDLTNTTYAYLSLLNGDSFSHKIGAGDYFNVVITGYSGINDGGTQTGTVTYSLGDYTNKNTILVNTWNTVDLTSLGSAKSLGFSFQSNITNAFGISVPEYVAVDNLKTLVIGVPEPSSLVLCLTGVMIGLGAPIRRLRLARITRV